MSEIPGDLHVHVRFDDLQLSIVHEGRAGDLALQQAILLQIPRAWLELLSETFGAKGAKVDEP